MAVGGEGGRREPTTAEDYRLQFAPGRLFVDKLASANLVDFLSTVFFVAL